MRVSAYNGVALSYGKTAPSTPPIVRPGEAPEPPSRVEVEASSPTSLVISWSPPTDAMGMGVTRYHVVSAPKAREREGSSIIPLVRLLAPWRRSLHMRSFTALGGWFHFVRHLGDNLIVTGCRTI